MGYRRKITEAICFYTTPEMRSDIEKMADERDVTISELMREIVTFYQTRNVNMLRTVTMDGTEGGEK